MRARVFPWAGRTSVVALLGRYASRLAELRTSLTIGLGIVALMAGATAADEIILQTAMEPAIAQASAEGKALLAIAVSPSCGPCMALKRAITESAEFGDLARDIVVLAMDVAGTEFTQFRQAYPQGYTGSVPVIYLIDPDRSVRHVAMGFTGIESLANLVRDARDQLGPPLSPQGIVETTAVLERIREQSREGHLVPALASVHEVAGRPGAADVLREARSYQAQLSQELNRRIAALAGNLSRRRRIYESSFRLAEIDAYLPNQLPLVGQARQVLREYQSQPGTRAAVLQARLLVRAQVAQSQHDLDLAKASYRAILRLDKSSPIGKYVMAKFAQSRQLPQERQVATESPN